MSIYDKYASTSVCQVDDECNHNTPPEKTITDHATQQGSVVSAGLSYGKDDIDNLTVIGSCSGGDGSRSGGIISIQNVNLEREVHPRQGTPRAVVMNADMKDSTAENDSPSTALSAIPSLTSHHNDVTKKRPLSVSSTSSATSTSSLPRPLWKKVAGINNPTSSLALNGGAGVSSSSASITSTVVTSQPSISTSEAVMMDALTDEDGEEDYTRCRTRSGVAALPSPGPQAQCNSGQTTDCHSMAYMSYIDKVVAEILETERTYVHDLNEIIKVSFGVRLL